MNASIYFNKSDKRYLSKDIDKLSDLNIEFLEDSSIVDPRFKLSTTSRGLEGNYLFVPDLGRYYYINNVIVSKGYIILECHVDVLMSYKDEIKEENIILKRQENTHNRYQDDPEFKLYQYTSVMTLEFPGGFAENDTQFLLTVVGNTSN